MPPDRFDPEEFSFRIGPFDPEFWEIPSARDRFQMDARQRRICEARKPAGSRIIGYEYDPSLGYVVYYSPAPGPREKLMTTDDLIGVRWHEFDPKTGKFRIGIAFEDGTGYSRVIEPSDEPAAFPDGVELKLKIGRTEDGK